MRLMAGPGARWTPSADIVIKTSSEADAMRAAGRAAAATLAEVGRMIRPGLSSADIDDFVASDTKRRGGVCAPLGYKGFPLHCCVSVNEVVCHGVPGPYKLAEGDIVNVDVTTILDGWHGDTSATFYVTTRREDYSWAAAVVRRAMKSGFEPVEPEEAASLAEHLSSIDPIRLGRIRVVEGCRLALDAGIRAVGPGTRVGDIGSAVSSVADALALSVVTDFAGHGIGKGFHEAPIILHAGKAGTGTRLRPGMIITVEPMLNLGEADVTVLGDGWTAVTADGSPSAQFEHTVLVTSDGHEVLTARDGVLANSEI